MRRLNWSILAIVCFAVLGLLLSRPAEASTWRALPSVSYDCYSADFVDAYRGWIGGTNWREDMLIEDLGLISRTDSGGEAWQESGTWTFLNVTDLDFIDHSRGWAVLDDGTILATDSGGSTWVVQAEGSFDFRDNNWTYESLSMADASHGCAVGSWVGLIGVSFPRIVYTSDGSEWKAAALPNLPGAHLEAVHMADAQSGWAVGSAGPGDLTPLILVTHDGGVTWVRQTGGLPSNGARLHGVWFVDGEHGWAVGDLGAVYATSDGGITWESQTSGTSATLLDVSFADPVTGWAVGEGGTILETVEAGDPWVQQSSGTDEVLRAVTTAGGSVWAVGDDGVVLTAAGVPGTGFTDIDSSPYRLAIASLAAAGIVNGFDDGTFRPNATMTRQQFAKVIALTLGLEVVDGFQPYPFTDVPRVENDPYPDDYIAVCAANGITQGTDPVKKLFSPYDPVTRAQVITMVVRAADAFQPGRLAYPPPGYDPTWGTFDSTHAANAARAEYNQLLEGLPLALLDPFGPIPRGEVAQILSNLLGPLEADRPGSSLPPITVLAVGDTTGHRILSGPDDTVDPLSALRGEAGGDLFVFNCEGPLLSSQPPVENRLPFPAQSSFWGYAKVGGYLRLADVNVANLANNHVLDYGRWGMDQTISELGGRGILTVGAGDDLAEATRSLALTIGGVDVAVLSYFAMDSPFFSAGPEAAGAAPWEGYRSESQIMAAADRSDIVVVYVHAHYGSSWTEELSPTTIDLAKTMMDAGADVVLVSGSHLAHGVLVREGKVALLGLGNFLFHPDYTLSANSRLSLLARVTLDGKHMEVALAPLALDQDGRPVVAHGSEAATLLDRVREQSAQLGTEVAVADDKGLVEVDRSIEARGESALGRAGYHVDSALIGAPR